MTNDPTKPLHDMQPQFEFFVGIDSDGCAFDTMEIKHKECFCPATIKYWGLQPISKFAREAFEFVNLYSKWRGANRWPALVKVMDLLRERPEVQARKFQVPEMNVVRAFIASGKALSNAGLKEYMAEHPDPELDIAWAWSIGVNDAVTDIVKGVPPFPYVRESLQLMEGKADIVVVSATPGEALEREWQEHGIDKFVRIIAGQEMGTKKQHLQAATVGKYAANHALMMGDAFGDLDAARANGCLFFPINPGEEAESWQRFLEEGFQKFIAGEFAGAYEDALVEEFKKFLPETPKW